MRQHTGPGLQEVAVVALAAGRLARAISVDEVAEPIRARLDAWASADGDDHAARRFLADLVRCPVCVGFWASLATSAAWPGRMKVRRGVAAAGVQVLLTLAERLVSERGRAEIHHADLAEDRTQTAA